MAASVLFALFKREYPFNIYVLFPDHVFQFKYRAVSAHALVNLTALFVFYGYGTAHAGADAAGHAFFQRHLTGIFAG